MGAESRGISITLPSLGDDAAALARACFKNPARAGWQSEPLGSAAVPATGLE
jgi:hypothetical protein